MNTGDRPEQGDFYLKIEGIKGETNKQGLADYMEIISFRWGGKHSGSFQRDEGGATGKFTGSDFEFVMKTNTASPELMQACANGKHFTRATLVCRKATGHDPMDYLKVVLSPVIISNFETGFAPDKALGDPVVVDQISLNFGKIVFEYKPNKDDGTPGPAREGGYDLQKGRSGK